MKELRLPAPSKRLFNCPIEPGIAGLVLEVGDQNRHRRPVRRRARVHGQTKGEAERREEHAHRKDDEPARQAAHDRQRMPVLVEPFRSATSSPVVA